MQYIKAYNLSSCGVELFSTYENKNKNINVLYSPMLRIDKSIEQVSGIPLTCSSISITIYKNDVRGTTSLYSFDVLTAIEILDYDIEGYFIIKLRASNEIVLVTNGYTFLAVLEYNTSNGIIKRTQHIALSSNQSLAQTGFYKSCFLVSQDHCDINFYTPECEKIVAKVVSLGTAIYPDITYLGNNHMIAFFGSSAETGTLQTVAIKAINVANTITYKLRAQDSCRVIPCGGASQNTGGQGVFPYDIKFSNDPLNAVTGMMRVMYNHFTLPDRIKIQQPDGTVLFQHVDLTPGSNEFVLPITVGISGAIITVDAPSNGTVWENSFDCIKPFANISQGDQFLVPPEISVQNILSQSSVINISGTYTANPFGNDYTYVSSSLAGTIYTANKNLKVISDQRAIFDIEKIPAYIDPYTGIVVNTYKGTLKYPGEPSIIFTRCRITEGSERYEFGITTPIPEQKEIYVTVEHAGIGIDYYIFTMTGSVEYVKNSYSINQPISFNLKAKEELVDIIKKATQNTFGSHIPCTSGSQTLVTTQPGITGNSYTDKFSNPFYGTGQGVKFLEIYITNDYFYGVTDEIKEVTSEVTDISGYASKTGSVTGAGASNNYSTSFGFIFDGNSAHDMQITVTDSLTNNYRMILDVYDVSDTILLAGQSITREYDPLVGFPIFILHNVRFTQLARQNTDYTIAVVYPDYIYTAIYDIRLVTYNTYVPPTPP